MPDLIWDLLSKFLVTVPGGRRLAPQGAGEMLRSPAGLRGPGVMVCAFVKSLILNCLQNCVLPFDSTQFA